MPQSRSELSLRTLPWLRLFAELGVIFLGVTLSLLADDWRQSRSDRADERSALQELLADLEADSADLHGLMVNAAGDEAAAMWVYQQLREPQVDGDALARNVGEIYDAYTYKAPKATYEGLRSTGRLALIRDPELRRGITTYYEERQPYIFRFFETYQELYLDLRESFSWDVELAYDVGVGSFGGPGRLRLRGPWSEVPTDPQFLYRLQVVGILGFVIAQRSNEVLADNAKLRAAVIQRLRGE